MHLLCSASSDSFRRRAKIPKQRQTPFRFRFEVEDYQTITDGKGNRCPVRCITLIMRTIDWWTPCNSNQQQCRYVPMTCRGVKQH